MPPEVVRERYERLVSTVEDVAWAENRGLVGQVVEVLVAVGEGRKDASTGRMSGRARDGRLVHFNTGGLDIQPGDVVRTEVTYAAPHHLNADRLPLAHRRTVAAQLCAAGTPKVFLGMPK